MPRSNRQRYPDGTIFSKEFGGEIYTGMVQSFDTESGYYEVIYLEDNDTEDLEEQEIKELLELEDMTETQKKKRRRHKARATVRAPTKKKAKLAPTKTKKKLHFDPTQSSIRQFLHLKEGTADLRQTTMPSFFKQNDNKCQLAQVKQEDDAIDIIGLNHSRDRQEVKEKRLGSFPPLFCIELVEENGECCTYDKPIESGDLCVGIYDDSSYHHYLYHQWKHLDCWVVPSIVCQIAEICPNRVVKQAMARTFCSVEMKNLISCNYNRLSEEERILKHIWNAENWE